LFSLTGLLGDIKTKFPLRPGFFKYCGLDFVLLLFGFNQRNSGESI